MKTIQLSFIILALLTTFSCQKDDDSKDSKTTEETPTPTPTPTPADKNEIEINYVIEASGYKDLTRVEGSAEYADADGIQTAEIDEPWETTVMVPKGHNLYFRYKGIIEQGTLVVKATAVDKSNGKVVYSDQISETASFGTKINVDFKLEGVDLGN